MKAIENAGQGIMNRPFVSALPLWALALFGLILAEGYSFLLFHCLAEGFSILIACGIFILAWNTRRFMENNYLLFIGIAYIFIGGLDLVHTLIYKGMGVLDGYDANAPTQLWIAARYLESLSLGLASLWIGRKLSPKPLFCVYMAIFSILLAAILSGRFFPDCFIEGQGLTPFKIVSEYIISLILLTALALLYRQRQHFDPDVLRLLITSIILTMASEIAFTFYVSVYGLSNQVGHYLKIASFYLIYKAIIQTGLLRPYDLMFRDLNLSRQRLQAAHDHLELRVRERTAGLQAEIAERKKAHKSLLRLNRMLKTLSECNQCLVRATDELTFLTTMCGHIVRHGGYALAWIVLSRDNRVEALPPAWGQGEAGDPTADLDLTKAVGTAENDPIRTVLRTGRAAMLKDIDLKAGRTDWMTLAAQRGWVAAIILPLIQHEATLGALVICSHQPDLFDPPQLKLLKELADDASFGIATLRMRQQRQAVEAERQLLATAIDQAGECIAIAASNTAVEYINQAVERITGLEPRACIGRPLTALLSLNQAAPTQAILRNLGTGKSWSGRVRSKDGRGARLDLSVAISPVRGPSQEIERFVAIIKDISRESQMEHQLLQSQKMEAIGTLAGGIAHDFNNILSAIIGFTELTADSVGKNTMAYENLDEVLKAGKRAKELVNQILAFSRQTMPECKPVALKSIIAEAAKLLRSSLPATIDIRLNLDSDSLVMADPSQLHQVVMNLCTNAAHAMREKGGLLELTLRDEALDDEAAGCFSGLKPGRYLKLMVSDTGHGISEEILDHIFDPFYTTKASNEGTGMGLSVVHGIVRDCGGLISVRSAAQQGACFTIRLPAVKRAEESWKPDLDLIPMGRNEHILFVDDEPMLVNMGRQVLESLGYQVTTRTDGHQALDLVKAQPDRFDLVLTDMTMPGMTGDILAQQIMAIQPKLPIILCSGFSHNMDEHKAAAMGMRAYLRKPILKGQMARIIREVLKGSVPAEPLYDCVSSKLPSPVES
jgi:PAS domain S-box-containing protein